MRCFEALDAEFGSSAGDETVCDVMPSAIHGGAGSHAEDAFLAEFIGFARARNHPARAALELAHAALDAIDDVEGAWQSLRVEAWLAALAPASLAIDEAELSLLARAFVEWLVDRGRLSVHGQRLLARRIARFARREEDGAALVMAA